MRCSLLRTFLLVLCLLAYSILPPIPAQTRVAVGHVHAAAPTSAAVSQQQAGLFSDSSPGQSEVRFGVVGPDGRGVAAQSSPQVPASAQANTIRLTNAGFDPQELHVPAGTQVTWTNATTQTHVLLVMGAHQVFLPVVVGGSAGMTQVDSPSRSSRSVAPPAMVTLAPDQSYQLVLQHSATYPFHLTTAPYYAGRVIVGSTALPPDPGEVAPALDETLATSVISATQFLYSGPNPIQTGVAPGTIDAKFVAVLRGKVLDEAGQPLAGATVSVVDHPEFGQTLSREDGMYDLAVNGGMQLTLDYRKLGSMPAQRHLLVPWQDFVWLPDVALLPQDPSVTLVDLTAPGPKVARGSLVSDVDGARQVTLIFPDGLRAEILQTNGLTRSVSSLHIVATEFTVGSLGPEAMPGELPAIVGYTYAVDFDAAEVGPGEQLRFSEPVLVYLENFLDWSVGGIVPVGSYDYDSGDWVPSDNGRVVEVVAVTGGRADLDTSGDGLVDNGQVPSAATGEMAPLTPPVSESERALLAELYAPNQSVWRWPIDGLEAYDANKGIGPAPGAEYPDVAKPLIDLLQNPWCLIGLCNLGGSVIGAQNQTLGESVPVAGTRFRLHYQSQRTPGFRAAYQLDVPVSGDPVPDQLKRIEVYARIAGRVFTETLAAAPNQMYHFEWDGLDAYGRRLQGTHPLFVRLGYVYDAYYTEPPELTRSFGYQGSGGGISLDRARMESTLWQEFEVQAGTWDGRANGLGGWSLTPHHAYDPVGRILYLGGGRQRDAAALGWVIDTAAGAGTSAPYANDVPATEAHVDTPHGLAVAADGTFYLTEYKQCTIRRVDREGTIRPFAGAFAELFPCGFEGDGGAAEDARLDHPADLALGSDGGLYVADAYNHRIRRIAPDGTISTVVGSGPAGQNSGSFAGDDGPAAAARLNQPHGLAISPDGSLFVADTLNNRVRQVRPDGTINTIAGTGSAGYNGDGILATAAQLDGPTGVDVGPDGSVYIADAGNGRVRRVGADGVIQTVAGGGTQRPLDGLPATSVQMQVYKVLVAPDSNLYIAGENWGWRIFCVSPEGIITTFAGAPPEEVVHQGYAGDGGPPVGALIHGPAQMDMTPDGDLYFAERWNHVVRAVSISMAGFGDGPFTLPSENGDELYEFDAAGRHLRTVNALTGTPIYTFTYNTHGYLVSLQDGDGNVTQIRRTAGITPTAIVAPFGQETALAVNADGYLTTVSDPLQNRHAFTYFDEGLLKTFTNPRDQVSSYQYSDDGRLVQDADPAGGVTGLARVQSGNAYTATVRTSEGLTTTYRVGFLANGDQSRVNTFPNGTHHTAVIGVDATTHVTHAHGIEVAERRDGDPRYGMQVPLVAAQTLTTPAGIHLQLSHVRLASLAVPGDPLSLEALTDTLTINGRVSTHTYDPATWTWTSTSPAGRETVRRLDSQGRPAMIEPPGGASVTFSFEGGDLTQVAEGTRETHFSYDGGSGYLSSYTDAMGHTTTYTRDDDGRMLEKTTPQGATWQYAWDGNGNLTGLTEPGGTTSHTLAYDAADRLQLYRSPLGAEQYFSYDLDGRLIRRRYPSTQALEWIYDGGQLAALHTPEGEHSFSYDPATGLLSQALSRDGQRVSYAYDGNLLTQADWSGVTTATLAYEYDDDLRLSRRQYGGLDLALSYEADGLLTGVGGMTLSRDPVDGRLATLADGDFQLSFGYNTYGELSSASAAQDGALYQASYTRDDLGRITQKVETIGASSTTWTYAYDASGRLATVKRDGTLVESYTYDDVGNRIAMRNDLTGVTLDEGDYVYDAEHKLLTAGGTTYDYDVDGRLKSVAGSGGTATFDYNVDGTLASVTRTGQTITYAYDAQGRRIARYVDGARSHAWVFGTGRLPLLEYDGAGNLRTAYIYAEGAAPVKMVRGGTVYHLVNDHLGSPRLVVDETGTVIKRLDYDSFGNVISDTNRAFDLPCGFAAGMADPAHELIRFGARDYQPSTGRWAAPDPLLFGGGLHLYGYAGNDPVNRTDPTGTQSGLEFAIIIALVAIASAVGYGLLIHPRLCHVAEAAEKGELDVESYATKGPLYNVAPVEHQTTVAGAEVDYHADGSVTMTIGGQTLHFTEESMRRMEKDLNKTIKAVGSSS